MQAATQDDRFAGPQGRQNTEGRRPRGCAAILVICETAFSLLLVAAAGLLLRSFAEILKVDPGFRPEGVLTMRVALPDAVYSKPEQMRGFYDGLAGPGAEASRSAVGGSRFRASA